MLDMLGRLEIPGLMSGRPYLRKSGMTRAFLITPPLPTGLALMRALPVGVSSLSSGMSFPASSKYFSGL